MIPDAKHTGEQQPRVILIDDDRLLRKSLGRLLTVNGYQTSTYESFSEFLSADQIPPLGCAILDLNLPNSSGLEIQEELAKCAPTLSIIFLTGFGRVDATVRAMKAGAVDFLEKPVEDAILLQAVKGAIDRSRQSLKEQSEREALRRKFARLSRREREVFALITSGLLNKQAGGELGLTEKTIKVHRAHVMEKMEAGSFAELTKMAQQLGLDAKKLTLSSGKAAKTDPTPPPFRR